MKHWIALLAFLIVITISISVVKPSLHKPFIIVETEYGVKTEVTPRVENKVIKTDIQKTETVSKPAVLVNNDVSQSKNLNPVSVQNTTKVKQAVVNQPVKTSSKQIKTETPKRVKQDIKPIKEERQKPVKKAEPQKPAVQPKPEPKIIEQPKPEPKKAEPAKVEQETISWNIWRSKLANQIISEIRMPTVPEGTIFEFSFNVDKFGNISNIRTKSSTPQYTAYAIQYIAPVIRSFQGRTILKFPQGTERTSTLFESKWRVINGNVQYSSPSNFNDIEVVRNKS